ncbi:hypothetical protein [Clostridium arbusti]|uniref:hypothetical protein n=1 Tax=Clostridium arbusti TaxID=1137848 RepID=UPI0002899B4D|nr:hypothetical protein [Clostridium arbusti]
MIPIIKNICVIDNKDNSIASTYLKRAKQLVKKGRAKWLTEDSIKYIETYNPVNSFRFTGFFYFEKELMFA